MAIKYIGSKRTLVDAIASVASATGATTAVDLFTGTTRVAQALKVAGLRVTASDIATYSEVIAQCYISTDARGLDYSALDDALETLNALSGKAGYFTETFCVKSRYFQPKNGMKVDSIREYIEEAYSGSPLYPILLTSLMEAADRVDSTTGVQMAYLKQWSARSFNDMQLRRPELLEGDGITVRGDAMDLVESLPETSLMYLDPPYNQHRYFTNYHIWETLTRWDAPEHYGIACKRIDSRDEATKSIFNKKREMPVAFKHLISKAKADTLLVSYNNEAWITPEEMIGALKDSGREDVRIISFDRKRYVGAQIGIHNLRGEKVGDVSHLRNLEYLFIAGDKEIVAHAARAGELIERPSQVKVATLF